MKGRAQSKKIKPKTMDEACRIIREVLIRGDVRYYDAGSEFELAFFLVNRAIVLEEKILPALPEPSDKDVAEHSIQGTEKYVAKQLLKALGFQDKDILFERRFYGSIPDVFARRGGSVILVECCSCRVSKIIEYLSLAEIEEVWIITYGEGPWMPLDDVIFEKMQWFIFKRGKKWEEVFSLFDISKRERLREVHRRAFSDFKHDQ